MSQAAKVCPICQLRNARDAAVCVDCGANLDQVAPSLSATVPLPRGSDYDFRYGETDLAESTLWRRGQRLGACLVLVLGAIVALSAALLLFRRIDDSRHSLPAPTQQPTRMAGPSVTPGPPTATFTPSPVPTAVPSDTPTPAPCLRTVASGDSLISIIIACGYQTLDIMPTVMALNGIADEAFIRAGQEIRVPPPSPTRDPLATAAPTALPQSDSAAADGALTLLAFDPFAPTLTATLLPGLMWHTVRQGDTMIAIAVRYETDAKSLSDLNPEVPFPLCDFSSPYGGPECTVQLSENQLLRVPAPTPTQTPISTLSGSETPTPSPTATFNAPLAQSPADLTYFAEADQVTLRWVGTGALQDGQRYRVTVTADDKSAVYSATTRELFFIIPAAWQASGDGRHIFTWQVSVVDEASGISSYFSQERRFVWQGAGATR